MYEKYKENFDFEPDVTAEEVELCSEVMLVLPQDDLCLILRLFACNNNNIFYLNTVGFKANANLQTNRAGKNYWKGLLESPK